MARLCSQRVVVTCNQKRSNRLPNVFALFAAELGAGRSKWKVEAFLPFRYTRIPAQGDEPGATAAALLGGDFSSHL